MPEITPRKNTPAALFSLTALVALLTACGSTAPSSAPHVSDKAEPAAIQASVASGASNDQTVSRHAWDGDPNTKWSASGEGAWIKLNLGEEQVINGVSLAFHRGDNRQARFDVEVSGDDATWTKVLENTTSGGKTTELEAFSFPERPARFVRITNRGNTENTEIALTEVRVHRLAASAKTPDGTTGTERTPNGDAVQSAPAGRAFYVDCDSGRDGNTGTSPDQAWRSIDRASDAKLNPGQALLLKRGCSWTGPLKVRSSGTASEPVTISAYGTGERPLIRNGNPGAVSVYGKHVIVDGLQATADRPGPYKHAKRCKNTPNGFTVGFAFVSGAQHNTLRNAKATGLTTGVHVQSGASHNKILSSEFVHNDVMSSNTPGKYDDDSGAWGVLLNGDDNEVAYNYFEGNTACSEDYGVEGASLELYKAKRNYMHHNRSINDSTFTELGGTRNDRSEDNTYAFNLYAPIKTGGELVVVRGAKAKWGANPGTKFYNNTAYKVSVGISCSHGCGRSILSARNNIVWLRDDADKAALWADGLIDEGNNIFWKDDGKPLPVIEGGDISGSSRIANPRFVNPEALNFELDAGSPALGAGSVAPLRDLKVHEDLAGRALHADSVDIGAFSRR